jgi:hypothetical protein
VNLIGKGEGNVLIVEGIPGVGQHLDDSQFKIVDGKIHVLDSPMWEPPVPLLLQSTRRQHRSLSR